MVSLLYISTVTLLWLDIYLQPLFLPPSLLTRDQTTLSFLLLPPLRWRIYLETAGGEQHLTEETHRENKIWELTFYDWIFVRSPVLEFSFNNFFIDVSVTRFFVRSFKEHLALFTPSYHSYPRHISERADRRSVCSFDQTS